MPHLPLDLRYRVAGIALKPASVQVLGCRAELDGQVVGQVLRFDVTAFFMPQTQHRSLVLAHDDPGI